MVSGISVEDAWRTTHEPEPLQTALGAREVLVDVDLTVADHHVGFAAHDRRDKLRDVGALVLVVRVGVDDHVGAELQRRVEPRLEGRCQALVVGQPHEVIDTVSPRGLDRRVGRAVVDHQPLDDVEPGNRPRQVRERGRELVLLVETGDLDDELHVRKRTKVDDDVALFGSYALSGRALSITR